LKLCITFHFSLLQEKDGASQMAMEDIAMFRSLPGSTVFCPSDAASMQRAAELAASMKGICYIRSSRTVIPVMYRNDELFEIGKAKVYGFPLPLLWHKRYIKLLISL
jgi:transketolase